MDLPTTDLAVPRKARTKPLRYRETVKCRLTDELRHHLDALASDLEARCNARPSISVLLRMGLEQLRQHVRSGAESDIELKAKMIKATEHYRLLKPAKKKRVR